METSVPFCTIVPPHILDRLAQSEDATVSEPARRTLEHDVSIRIRRMTATRPAPAGSRSDKPQRTIHDAGRQVSLPGRRVQAESDQPSKDAAASRAHASLGATFDFYLKAYGRHSIDDSGLPLDATVHYGGNYMNAFWDGHQMVFGDGDGDIFLDFTSAVDVIGHELTHGVIQYSANLDYYGQSGALNESVSDVFGSLVKQYALGQTVDEADWLIGAGLFGSDVRGQALRSLKEPGTAYDDDRIGKDPQPATMARMGAGRVDLVQRTHRRRVGQ